MHQSPEIQSFKTSIQNKCTPFKLKSWVALSLTLDGRDKITKVIQYTSRLFAYYYETVAKSLSITDEAMTSSTAEKAATASKMLYSYYSLKTRRYRNLQKALTTSRKAYRLGRTFIEIEKLMSMNLFHWVAWHIRNSLMKNSGLLNDTNDDTAADDDENSENINNENENSENINNEKEHRHKFDDQQKEASSVSWHPDIDKQKETHHKTPTHLVNIPRQISSNIGWGPSSYSYKMDKRTGNVYHKLSSLGKLLYISMSSIISENLLQERESSSSSPPLWKVVFTSLKVIGLGGFWAGDNISYLYSTGFLIDDKKKSDTKNKAALFATRSYFFAAITGLYLSGREWISHRNNMKKIMERITDVRKILQQIEYCDYENKAYKEHQQRQELSRLESTLYGMKKMHVKLCLAFLKSCCDVTVFSNNPGVDLHLKYRGRKMNEGLQCIFGVTSALTVIYNNYPVMKK